MTMETLSVQTFIPGALFVVLMSVIAICDKYQRGVVKVTKVLCGVVSMALCYALSIYMDVRWLAIVAFIAGTIALYAVQKSATTKYQRENAFWWGLTYFAGNIAIYQLMLRLGIVRF